MKTIKKTILGLAVLSSFSILNATAQQVRTVGDFTGIKVEGTLDVSISQSDANTVKIDAPDNVQSQIKTEVKDGILIISGDATAKSDKPATISVSIKSLTSLDVSGTGDVKSEN